MNRRTLLLGGTAMVALGGILSPGQSPISLLVGEAHAQDASDIDTSTIVEMVEGDPDAPVTIVEYASYTCPHCASFHTGTYQELKKNYIDTGKAKLVYREVYFDRYGLWASMIARCGGPEKFFGINDLLFKKQGDWTSAGDATAIVDELRTIGKLAGLDDATLDACLQDSENAQTLVAWFQKNAEADGVTGTPSFVINGEKVGNMSYDDFAARIDAELAK